MESGLVGLGYTASYTGQKRRFRGCDTYVILNQNGSTNLVASLVGIVVLVLLQNLVLYDGVDGVGSGVRQVLGGGVVGVEPAEPVTLLPHSNLLLLHPVLLVTNHRPGTADSKTKPYSQLFMIQSQN